mmetsp:Transcript_29978/g.54618  ORF Transcript_29978/g.54618 Transcript_29978/m.54618 type:complete len:215 (-) Transcript_29978:225-869(-)
MLRRNDRAKSAVCASAWHRPDAATRKESLRSHLGDAVQPQRCQLVSPPPQQQLVVRMLPAQPCFPVLLCLASAIASASSSSTAAQNPCPQAHVEVEPMRLLSSGGLQLRLASKCFPAHWKSSSLPYPSHTGAPLHASSPEVAAAPRHSELRPVSPRLIPGSCMRQASFCWHWRQLYLLSPSSPPALWSSMRNHVRLAVLSLRLAAHPRLRLLRQ